MQALMAKVKATGLPMLCQEAGFDKLRVEMAPSARRWHDDTEAAFHKNGLARLKFSAGVSGRAQERYALGVGLT